MPTLDAIVEELTVAGWTLVEEDTPGGAWRSPDGVIYPHVTAAWRAMQAIARHDPTAMAGSAHRRSRL